MIQWKWPFRKLLLVGWIREHIVVVGSGWGVEGRRKERGRCSYVFVDYVLYSVFLLKKTLYS